MYIELLSSTRKQIRFNIILFEYVKATYFNSFDKPFKKKNKKFHSI